MICRMFFRNALHALHSIMTKMLHNPRGTELLQNKINQNSNFSLVLFVKDIILSLHRSLVVLLQE